MKTENSRSASRVQSYTFATLRKALAPAHKHASHQREQSSKIYGTKSSRKHKVVRSRKIAINLKLFFQDLVKRCSYASITMVVAISGWQGNKRSNNTTGQGCSKDFYQGGFNKKKTKTEFSTIPISLF